MEKYLLLQCVPEIHTTWYKNTPIIKNYLKVPSAFLGYNELLSLSVCIKKVISPEFEEEEVEYEDDASNKNGEYQLVLRNRNLLHCSVCLEPMCTPVFQCRNGHLACSSCSKVKKTKCPVCFPILHHFKRYEALDELIESIVISCKYARYGCKQTWPYIINSCDHEETCSYIRCFCPHPLCPFVSSLKNVYLHFEIKHAASATLFTYNTTFSLDVDINQKHIFLQEQHQREIFVLNHQVQQHGRAFDIYFAGIEAIYKCFVYQLTAKSRTLKAVPERYYKWYKHPPLKNYLTVPSDFDGYNGLLSLTICITEGHEALRWISFRDK